MEGKKYWGKKFYESRLNTVLLFILIVLMVVALIAINKNNKLSNTVDKEDAGPVGISFEDMDALPLSTEFKWNYPEDFSESFSNLKLKGYKANSEIIQVQSSSEIAERSRAFRKFYEDQLKPWGYVDDSRLDADGVYSSKWGYKRDKYYVVLNYYAKQINPKDEVGGGPCPCTFQVGVFTATKEE